MQPGARRRRARSPRDLRPAADGAAPDRRAAQLGRCAPRSASTRRSRRSTSRSARCSTAVARVQPPTRRARTRCGCSARPTWRRSARRRSSGLGAILNTAWEAEEQLPHDHQAGSRALRDVDQRRRRGRQLAADDPVSSSENEIAARPTSRARPARQPVPDPERAGVRGGQRARTLPGPADRQPRRASRGRPDEPADDRRRRRVVLAAVRRSRWRWCSRSSSLTYFAFNPRVPFTHRLPRRGGVLELERPARRLAGADRRRRRRARSSGSPTGPGDTTVVDDGDRRQRPADAPRRDGAHPPARVPRGRVHGRAAPGQPERARAGRRRHDPAAADRASRCSSTSC